MKTEDLDIYAKSYPLDALMIRCVVLRRLEFDEDTVLTAGEEVELEPDVAALLHREGAVAIVVSPSRDLRGADRHWVDCLLGDH